MERGIISMGNIIETFIAGRAVRIGPDGPRLSRRYRIVHKIISSNKEKNQENAELQHSTSGVEN